MTRALLQQAANCSIPRCTFVKIKSNCFRFNFPKLAVLWTAGCFEPWHTWHDCIAQMNPIICLDVLMLTIYLLANVKQDIKSILIFPLSILSFEFDNKTLKISSSLHAKPY